MPRSATSSDCCGVRVSSYCYQVRPRGSTEIEARLARIVGVQIDVNPCNKVVPKLEDVTEASAGGLARFPGLAVRH